MAPKRRDFGSIYRRRASDGARVPAETNEKCRPGYYVRVRRGPFQIDRKAGSTKQSAVRLLARILRRYEEWDDAGRPNVPRVLFGEFAERHLQWLERAHTPTTYARERNLIRNVFIPRFGDLYLCDITHADVETYLDERVRVDRIKPATLNRDACILSRLFKRAVKLGMTDANPVAGFERQKEELKAVPYLDRDQQAALVAACTDRMRDLVELALATGMRQRELLLLRWADVDEQQRTILVKKAKSKLPRMVPLTTRARTVLERRKPADSAPSRTDRIFPEFAESGHPGPLARWVREACSRAGLEGMTFHDLRHVFGSYAARRGIPIPDLAKIMGHASIQMTMRYARHAPGDVAQRAADLLDGES